MCELPGWYRPLQLLVVPEQRHVLMSPSRMIVGLHPLTFAIRCAFGITAAGAFATLPIQAQAQEEMGANDTMVAVGSLAYRW